MENKSNEKKKTTIILFVFVLSVKEEMWNDVTKPRLSLANDAKNLGPLTSQNVRFFVIEQF